MGLRDKLADDSKSQQSQARHQPTIFEDIAGAQSNTFFYIPTGKHILRVVQIFLKTGDRGTSCIGEFEVIQSTNDQLVPGMTVSFARPRTNHNFAKDVKALMVALLDKPEHEVTDAHVQWILSEDNPAAGEVVECIGVPKPTKSGGVFTVLTWRNAPNEKSVSEEGVPF